MEKTNNNNNVLCESCLPVGWKELRRLYPVYMINGLDGSKVLYRLVSSIQEAKFLVEVINRHKVKSLEFRATMYAEIGPSLLRESENSWKLEGIDYKVGE